MVEEKESNKEETKKAPAPKANANAEPIAVIRIRGGTRIRGDIKDTLAMLNLHNQHNLIIIPNKPNNLGMLKKAKDYITWGVLSEAMKKELETKKSESEAKDKVIEEYVKKIRGEYDKLEKELRDARNTLLTLTEEVEEIPGKIHEIDEKLAKNTRQLDEDKKQLILIEKDSNKAKTNLDSNLNTRDIIKDGYDKEVEKMRKIEDKFKVYEKIEKQPEEIKYLKQRVAEALNTIPKIEEER